MNGMYQNQNRVGNVVNKSCQTNDIGYDDVQEYVGNVYIRSHTRKDNHSSTLKYTSLQFYYTKEYYHDYKQVKNLARQIWLER